MDNNTRPESVKFAQTLDTFSSRWVTDPGSVPDYSPDISIADRKHLELRTRKYYKPPSSWSSRNASANANNACVGGVNLNWPLFWNPDVVVLMLITYLATVLLCQVKDCECFYNAPLQPS